MYCGDLSCFGNGKLEDGHSNKQIKVKRFTGMLAGQVYECIDVESYKNNCSGNDWRLRKLAVNNRFTLTSVNPSGGFVLGNPVISNNELRFFKLVEDKEITPEGKVTLTISYRELARVYLIMGKVNGDTHGDKKTVFKQAKELLDPDLSKWGEMSKSFGGINYYPSQDKWESMIFGDTAHASYEKQKKQEMIDKLKRELEQAQKELDEM